MVGGGYTCCMHVIIDECNKTCNEDRRKKAQLEQFEHARRKMAHEHEELRKMVRQAHDEKLKKLNAHHEIEGDEIIENIENTDIERGRVEHLEHGEIESRLFY
jgi:hypothetical protein